MPSEEEKQACLQRVPVGQGSNMEYPSFFNIIMLIIFKKDFLYFCRIKRKVV